MRMSDYFVLPLEARGHALYRSGLRHLAEFSNGKEVKAAAHAINCHDELVEALDEAEGALAALEASGLLKSTLLLTVSNSARIRASAILNKPKGT